MKWGDILGESNILDEDYHKKAITVVRVRTSFWWDGKSLNVKKSITPLKRKSFGYNLIIDQIEDIGSDETYIRITNLDECEDGIYEVVTCNESRDWESGYIEDYDFELIPYSEHLDR